MINQSINRGACTPKNYRYSAASFPVYPYKFPVDKKLLTGAATQNSNGQRYCKKGNRIVEKIVDSQIRLSFYNPKFLKEIALSFGILDFIDMSSFDHPI